MRCRAAPGVMEADERVGAGCAARDVETREFLRVEMPAMKPGMVLSIMTIIQSP